MSAKKEDILKAHSDGCSDVKKVLETLYPELFEKKIEFTKNNIYGCVFMGSCYILKGGSEYFNNKWHWVTLSNSNTVLSSPENTPEAQLKNQPGYKTFNKQLDFYKWLNDFNC